LDLQTMYGSRDPKFRVIIQEIDMIFYL
jgi:hypothetical protein